MKSSLQRRLTARGSLIRRSPRVKEVLRAIMTRVGSHDGRGGQPDIIMLSTPRSGTTWLMECLSAERRLRFVNEPFTPRFRERIALHQEEPLKSCSRGFGLFPDHPDLPGAMLRLLRDFEQTRICGPYNPLAPSFKLHTNRRAFKIICAAQAARHWAGFAPEFSTFFLIRHPIPTCLSRQREYQRPDLAPYLESEAFCASYLDAGMRAEVERCLDAATGEFRVRLVEWCLEHLAPIKELWGRPSWPWFFYEDLREDLETELARLAGHCGLHDEARILRQAEIPSASTHPSRQNDIRQSGGRRAHGWVSKVDAETLRMAQEVLDTFGISLYRADEPRPLRDASA